MTEETARELRRHTGDILKRAATGEEITITLRCTPVAVLVPVDRSPRRPFNKTELIAMIESSQADSGLRRDLDQLAGDTTDDLGSPL